MSARLTLALIGCGNIAQHHWRGIQAHAPRIEVAAVVDTNPALADTMAAQTGAQPFYSLETALASGKFAAVDIMLPHHLHEQAALASFAAGKHVMLEKPMSISLDSCERILAAARAAGTVFMVAEQAQYWPDALAVKALIDGGALGDVITARAYFGNPAHQHRGPKPWRYFNALAGGGIAIDGGAHWLRPLRMWLGEIDEVVATTGRPLADMEGESLVRALLRFKSGVVAVFDALHGGAYAGSGEEFRVTGTLGEVLIEKGPGGRVMLFDEAHPKGHALMTKDEGRAAAFGYELHDFAAAVLDGTALAAGPEYSLGELRTALAFYRSAANKRWESVWDER